MINALFEVLLNILIVFGGATTISIVGVGILLLGERIIAKIKSKK